MKHLKFLVIILSLGLITACTNKSSKSKETSSEDVSDNNVAENKYVTFYENDSVGVKNDNNEILIPAQYNNIEYVHDVIIAQQGMWYYLFKDNEPIFDHPTTNYEVTEENIICADNDVSMIYFFKTGLALQNLLRCIPYEEAFFCKMYDETYAFYALDGETKASGLKNIICLQKITRDGRIKEELFLFNEDGNDEKKAYDQNGNFKYKLNWQTWQTLAGRYLTKVPPENTMYPLTFTYRINIDAFVYDETMGYTLHHYPEED